MKEFMITPADQRVVVLPEKPGETTTKMGIIIPGTVDNSTPEIAKVVAVGNGDKDNPMLYRINQKVIYSQYSGVEIKFNLFGHGENTYKVMNQLDIMAVIEEVD